MKNYRIEIKWALIFTVMMLGWMLLEKLTGLHSVHIDKHPVYTNFFAIPAIAVYVLALFDKRKNDYHGYMNYQQGFVSGLIITLIVAILSPLTQYITLNFISPEYLTNVTEYVVANDIMSQEAAEKQFSFQSYVIQGLIGSIFMGLLTSALVALVTRKKRKPAQAAEAA